MTLFAQCARLCCLAAVCLLAAPTSALAATVWNGPLISFSKAPNADHRLEANQDRITDSVWITRGSGQGIYNIQMEIIYTSLSPADTEWAWALAGFNTGLEIAATNYESLEFNPWVIAHGGAGGGPPSTVGIPGVLHLITDDIYIDIMFTSWGVSRSSGAPFSYVRSTVPEPSTASLLALGLVALAVRRRAPVHGSKNAA